MNNQIIQPRQQTQQLQQQRELPNINNLLIKGDLAGLNEEQKTNYYMGVCKSLGLNPFTKPFQYLDLGGKHVLYASKDCTEQLRKIYSVSLSIVSRELIGQVFLVTARATSRGRTDESIGAVPLTDRYGKPLTGDALANAYMKAETKAKRRVTLSVCGLGMLDESETDSIENAVKIPDQPVQPVAKMPQQQITQEPIKEPVKVEKSIIESTPQVNQPVQSEIPLAEPNLEQVPAWVNEKTPLPAEPMFNEQELSDAWEPPAEKVYPSPLAPVYVEQKPVQQVPQNFQMPRMNNDKPKFEWPSEKQRKLLYALCMQKFANNIQWAEQELYAKFDFKSINDVTAARFKDVIDWLKTISLAQPNLPMGN